MITGAPQLDFKDTTSLLQSDIAAFSNSVLQGGNSFFSSGSIMSQNMAYNSAASFGFSASTATTVGPELSDIAYYPIGPISLAKGVSQSMTVKSSTANYRRVVEWDVATDETYDALEFRNPLSFALTTAPVTVVEASQLKGQSSCKWTPPNGTVLKGTH